MKPTIKYALLHALGTTLYIVAIVSFIDYITTLFGEKEETILIPIGMLSLFVLSAAITGSLILGRPALWYIDGKKKEAITLLFATLGFFLLFTILSLLTLYVSVVR